MGAALSLAGSMLGVALLAAPAARAEAGGAGAGAAREQAYTLYQEGVALFRARKYRQAAEKLQLAYNLDPAAELLYNLGRAHEEAGAPDAAVTHFRAYLSRYPDAADAADVQARIERLERVERGGPPPRIGLGVELGLGFGGGTRFGDVERRGTAGQYIAGGDDDLEGAFSLAASYHRPLTGALQLGARIGWSRAATAERDATLQSFDLALAARMGFPAGRVLEVFGDAAIGPSWAALEQSAGEVGAGSGGTFDFSGFGWHLQLGGGVAWPVTEAIDLTVGLAFHHLRVSTLSGEKRVRGVDYRLELPDTRARRFLLLAGARF